MKMPQTNGNGKFVVWNRHVCCKGSAKLTVYHGKVIRRCYSSIFPVENKELDCTNSASYTAESPTYNYRT